MDPKEVMEMATNNYMTLFQQERPTVRARYYREELWSHTPRLMQPSMGETLLAPFTMTKMQEAVLAIDGQKCPGEHGLSKAFFTTFWEQIHQPLLAAFQQIFSNIQMSKSLSADLICLLPKGGNR